MKAMDKAFTRVDETFEAIRDSLNQQAINNIARKLAQDLRRAQQARIRSQKAPDGTAWTPRRRRVTRIQERIRFIWNRCFRCDGGLQRRGRTYCTRSSVR